MKVEASRLRVARDPSASGGEAFRDGVRAIGATVLGTFCWGLVTGVAMVKAGLGTVQALGMVMLVYSGTAQLAALPLLAAGASLPVIWLAALLANLRFVVYSAVVATEFRGLSTARRLALGWMTTDTGLAAYFGRGADARRPGEGDTPVAHRAARFLGTNLTVYVGWSLGALAGVLLAGLIPDSPRIAFVGVLAVMALVGPMLDTRAAVAAAVAAALAALAGTGWPWRAGTFAAIAAGVLAALALTRDRATGAR
ncbi:MAG TPA: AzlC family ABC transporter permease [Burkholderiaceae bacterium]|nr:AzlC family ABC transporter permease [Burkholderiaceae bacterium]